MKIQKSIFDVISVFFFIMLSVPCFAEKNGITINKTENTMSVNLINADMADIARQISKDGGIKVFLDKSISSKISVEFKNLPMELGIKRLLGPELNSAFIFVKENHPSDRVSYRLETVKIFNKGNVLTADFMEFGEGSSTSSAAADTKTENRKPGTPEAINQEMMSLRKNFDLLRQKNESETDYINSQIVEMQIKLSQNPSPEERMALLQQFNQAKQDLSKVNSVNTLMITDEERNLRELMDQSTKMESRIKYSERKREAGKMK